MLADGIYRLWVSPSQVVTVRNISDQRDLTHYEVKDLLKDLKVGDWKVFLLNNRFKWFFDSNNWMFRDFKLINRVGFVDFELIE